MHCIMFLLTLVLAPNPAPAQSQTAVIQVPVPDPDTSYIFALRKYRSQMERTTLKESKVLLGANIRKYPWHPGVPADRDIPEFPEYREIQEIPLVDAHLLPGTSPRGSDCGKKRGY